MIKKKKKKERKINTKIHHTDLCPQMNLILLTISCGHVHIQRGFVSIGASPEPWVKIHRMRRTLSF